MFKCIKDGPEGGDCTARYKVELRGDYTVLGFIIDVVSNNKEWGYIGIDNGNSIFGDPNCEYSHGELLSMLPGKYLNLKVLSAKASGGWSRMDYLLTVEKQKEVSNENT